MTCESCAKMRRKKLMWFLGGLKMVHGLSFGGKARSSKCSVWVITGLFNAFVDNKAFNLIPQSFQSFSSLQHETLSKACHDFASNQVKALIYIHPWKVQKSWWKVRKSCWNSRNSSTLPCLLFRRATLNDENCLINQTAFKNIFQKFSTSNFKLLQSTSTWKLLSTNYTKAGGRELRECTPQHDYDSIFRVFLVCEITLRWGRDENFLKLLTWTL